MDHARSCNSENLGAFNYYVSALWGVRCLRQNDDNADVLEGSGWGGQALNAEMRTL